MEGLGPSDAVVIEAKALWVHVVTGAFGISTVYLERCYREMRDKRGTGRARIGSIRKLCGRRSDRWLDGHHSGYHSGAGNQEDQP